MAAKRPSVIWHGSRCRSWRGLCKSNAFLACYVAVKTPTTAS